MKRIAIFAALVLAACGDDSTGPTLPVSSSTAVAAANSWLARADYPKNLYDAASAPITNSSTGRTTLYVMGGQPTQGGYAGTISNLVNAFDVSANTWAAKAPLPLRIRSSNGAVEINGKIYISGGFTRRWDENRGLYFTETLRSLYVYTPAANTWTRKRDMPITTAEGVSGAYQGMLYVATSCDDSAVCSQDATHGALWRYNPTYDTWVLLSRTPHNPGYGGGGFAGGKLYLVDNLGDVDIFDPATKTWSTGPKRPFRYCAPASAAFQAKLYLVGCHADDDWNGVYPMLVFDPKVGSWSQVAAPPVEATGHLWTLSRVVVNGQPRLELVGGTRPGNNWQWIP
jgi:hypothetical protein